MTDVRFFGYGLLSDRSIVKQIIGRDPGEGKSAVVEGFQLAYQVLSQIPENIRPVLQKTWGETFKAYTLRTGSGIVAGVIWELSEEELGKLMTFEFVGVWRESVTGTAKTGDGTPIPVRLIKVSDAQPIEETVEGIRYETNLNRTTMVKDGSKEQDEELLSTVRRQLEELTAQQAYGKQSFA